MSVSDLKRFPIKGEPGRIILLEIDKIYYIQAEGDDCLVRTARKKAYNHVEPLDEVETRLPSPPFFRIHRSYIVNLDRVLELRTRGERDYEVKMDPPVNKVLPVSRRRYGKLAEVLGI
jgi:DNA-binding LytR/AlgR family response regulator